MELIMFSLAGICFIYFIIIVAYSGISTAYCGIWLLLAAVFIVMGCFRARSRGRKDGMPRRLPIFVYTSFVLAMVVSIAAMSLVISGRERRTEADLDYVVIVGDRVFADGISTALRLKLDRAVQYFVENRRTILVLSGGQQEGDPVPEALAMYNYLRFRGVPEQNMVMEMDSENTRENIRFSLDIIEQDLQRRNRDVLPGLRRESEDLRIGILTSDFNMYRSMRYARKDGYPEVYGISTRTDLVLYPHECVRETCALVGDMLTGRL